MGTKESGVEHPKVKLDQAAKNLWPHISGDLQLIESRPCNNEAETWGCRCNCAFQLIQDGPKSSIMPCVPTEIRYD